MGQVCAQRPWRAERRAKGEQHEQVRGGRLVHQEVEKLQGGGVQPVQVFDDQQDPLSLHFTQQPHQQGFQGLLFLPFWRQGERGIGVG
jgi:hypothetical protein